MGAAPRGAGKNRGSLTGVPSPAPSSWDPPGSAGSPQQAALLLQLAHICTITTFINRTFGKQTNSGSKQQTRKWVSSAGSIAQASSRCLHKLQEGMNSELPRTQSCLVVPAGPCPDAKGAGAPGMGVSCGASGHLGVQHPNSAPCWLGLCRWWWPRACVQRGRAQLPRR